MSHVKIPQADNPLRSSSRTLGPAQYQTLRLLAELGPMMLDKSGGAAARRLREFGLVQYNRQARGYELTDEGRATLAEYDDVRAQLDQLLGRGR